MINKRTHEACLGALVTILLLLTSFAWGQGRIGEIVFARGEANVEPVDPGESFEAGIGIVYAFFEFEQLNAADVISGTWYLGEEALITQATTLSQLLGAAGVVPTGKLYFSLVLEDGAPPGVYRLDISLNSMIVRSRKFTIEEVVAGAGQASPGGADVATPVVPAPEVAPPVGPAPPTPVAPAPALAQPAPVAPAPEAAPPSGPDPVPPVAQRSAPDPAAAVSGSFEEPGVAAAFSPGETVSLLFHYQEKLTDPQLVFAYRGVAPGTIWGWRLTREGQVLAEQMDLAWEAEGEGLHAQPLGLELGDGNYDVDLYLGGELVGSTSVTVGAPVIAPERLLFDDEFDDPGSGWGTVSSPDGIIEYRDSRLLFTLNGRSVPAVSVHQGIFGDAIAEVVATTVGGPVDNALGIVARYQDDGNYYAFLVSADGYYSILHFEDGQPVWDQQWQFDGLTGIEMGMASNRLRVLAQGSLLRFYVNGRLRGVVDDPLWLEGQMGVFGGVFDEPGVQVGFDEWRLWSLPNE